MMLADIIPAVAGARSAILTGVAAVALCLPLGYCKGYKAAKSKAAAELALANVAVLQKTKTADDAAAVERVNDALASAQTEQRMTDAISDTPDTAPDAVRVQLGCQRLREQGGAEADLPAVCRPGGGDRTQTPRTR